MNTVECSNQPLFTHNTCNYISHNSITSNNCITRYSNTYLSPSNHSPHRYASIYTKMSNKWLKRKQQQYVQQHNQNNRGDDNDNNVNDDSTGDIVRKSTSKRLTPMLQQWHTVKSKYPNYIVLFRVGEFYEILYEDAEIAADILSITLTQRNNRETNKSSSNIPMCGVPYFSVESYISKLIKSGYLVAMVEQVTDTQSSKPGSNNIIDRQITRLITPGTLIESSLLNPKHNNYLCSIVQANEKSSQLGIAFVDVSTGQFYTLQCTTSTLSHHIARIQPSEVLVTSDTHQYVESQLQNIRITLRDDTTFSRDVFIDLWHSMNSRDSVASDVSELSAVDQRIQQQNDIYEIHEIELQVQSFSRQELRAAGALLDYIRITHQNTLPRLTLPRRQEIHEYMSIDAVTRRALELTNSISNPSSKQQTLLDCIDSTVTPQGARLLSSRLALPLLDIERIHRRLDMIEYFRNDYDILDSIRIVLRDITDIERAIQRVSMKLSTPRDLHSIKLAIKQAKQIHQIIHDNNQLRLSTVTDDNNKSIHQLPRYLSKLLDTLQNDGLDELYTKLNKAIMDPPPLTLEHGHFVRTGYSNELDRLQQLSSSGNDAVIQLQEQYTQQTGIRLKIRRNPQLLHYVELTHSNKLKFDELSTDIKHQFIPIQQLKNKYRYKTRELMKLQDDILTSDTQINELESQIFDQLRSTTLSCSEQLMRLAHSIAIIDLSISNAKISIERNYCRPQLLQQSDRVEHRFDITQGRHPVVESRMMYNRLSHNTTHSTRQARGVASTQINDAQLLDAEVEKSATQSAINEVLPFMSILPLDVLNVSNRMMAEKLVHDNIDKNNNINTVSEFEPNDCKLEGRQRVWLLTGSNMSGKSTILRQNALISILAQTGLYVPADNACITIIDQVFCRVGASDDISNSLSTFMVEMQETAHILTNATRHSLCIFDELGRGTSTRDGLALASAALEYIHNTIECRAMFATHFTELSILDTQLPNLRPMRTAVEKKGDQIIFLHRLESGVSEHSYGIFVARLAGIPEPVLQRASILLDRFQSNTNQSLLQSLIDEQANNNNHDTDNDDNQSNVDSTQELIDAGKA